MLETMTRGTVVIRVPEILKARGISVTDFAQGAGLAYGTASALARGFVDRIDRKTLAAVCEYLNVTPGDILEYVVPDEDPKIQ